MIHPYRGGFFVWLTFFWTSPVGTLVEIGDGESERAESTGDEVDEGTGVFTTSSFRWLLPVNTLGGLVGIGDGGPEIVGPDEPAGPGLTKLTDSGTVVGMSAILSG